jgi:hypothetical protein
LHTNVVCPVFESITVFAGKQLQVTVLAFSCLTTTQCSMSSAVGGGIWLRMGGGVAATGFFAAQPASSRQHTSQAFLMPLFSLSRARLSMATLVTALVKTGQGLQSPKRNKVVGNLNRETFPRLSETFHVVCDIHFICLPHQKERAACW